mmetsp:Transcript_34216/g.102393  ORF Transcript_34216/g.102393 Transcript_34216/m.102393 type:complete len:129 (+) Transcript_34216:756-1142(+)
MPRGGRELGIQVRRGGISGGIRPASRSRGDGMAEGVGPRFERHGTDEGEGDQYHYDQLRRRRPECGRAAAAAAAAASDDNDDDDDDDGDDADDSGLRMDKGGGGATDADAAAAFVGRREVSTTLTRLC